MTEEIETTTQPTKTKKELEHELAETRKLVVTLEQINTRMRNKIQKLESMIRSSGVMMEYKE